MDEAAGMSGTADERFAEGAPNEESRGATARAALLAGFAQLALSRQYREIGVDCVVRAAKVARSTFYYHFSTKDDLLLENLRPLLVALAAAPGDSAPAAELKLWIEHLWQHRNVAARLLVGRTGEKLQSALTAELRGSLEAADCGEIDAVSVALRAEQAAGSTMTLLRAWTAHRISARPDDVAMAIWRAGKAYQRN